MSFDLPTLPGNWKYAALETCCAKNSVTYGVVQPGAALSAGKPIVRVNNFRDTRIDVSDVMYIAPEIESKYSRTRLQGGEVLLTVVGSVGQVAVVSPRLSGFNVARAVAVLHPLPHVAAEWIALCLRSPLSQHLLGSRANTTVQTTINLKDLRALPIPLPPEGERQTIVRFIGALDDRVTLLRETIVTLDAIAQSLFKSWFVDFDPVRAKMEGQEPRGMSVSIAALFPDGFEDSDLGLVPREWRTGTVNDIAILKGGKQLEKEAFDKNALNPIFGGAGVMGRTSLSNASGFVLTVGRVGAYCGQFFWHIGDAWVNNNASQIQARISAHSIWLYLWLSVVDMNVIKKGAAQPFVSNGDIAALKMVHPPDQIKDRFIELSKPIFERISRLRAQTQTLTTLRDALLPRLISGQLRLPDVELEFEAVAA